MDDAPHAERGEAEHGQRVVVVGPDEVVDLRHGIEASPEQRRPQEGRALVAAGQAIELQDECVEDHPKRQGEHAKVDLHVAHAERRDRYRHQRAQHRGREQDHLERADLGVRRQERAGVRAEPDEEGVAERDEARVPEQEVEPEQHDRVGHEREHEEHVIGRGDEGRCGDGRGPQRDRQAALHAVAPPKRPRGRATSTAITMR